MAVELEEQIKSHLKKPKRYVVFMLNDDYTTWDFCIRIITSVFHKSVDEADRITQDIHRNGKGLCGVYTHEIAETKADQVQTQAKQEGYPMRCLIEEQ